MHQHYYSIPLSPSNFTEWVACEYCDALHTRITLKPGERATCVRCGSVLYRSRSYRHLLPLVLTALILFAISNTYPIVELVLKGVHLQTTLWGAVQALYSGDMKLVAILILFTTILLPLFDLLMMCYLLVPMARRRIPHGFSRIICSIRQTRPWGMIEVFMVGVLVTIVKLSTIARVLPCAALWSFGALVVVLAAVLSYGPRELWSYADALNADDGPLHTSDATP